MARTKQTQLATKAARKSAPATGGVKKPTCASRVPQ
uniref:Histone H3 n=1 Tax=Oncorhynchus kisutch TaxID=8019 RepID=A0A8C7MRX5_ONCKI